MTLATLTTSRIWLGLEVPSDLNLSHDKNTPAPILVLGICFYGSIAEVNNMAAIGAIHVV